MKLICIWKLVLGRLFEGCQHLGCRLSPEIPGKITTHVLAPNRGVHYVATAEEKVRPSLPLVKRHITSAVKWLRLYIDIHRRGRGGEKGPEAENRTVSVRGGSSHDLFWLFKQLCDSREIRALRGVFILNIVLHCFTVLHSIAYFLM